MTSIRSSVRPKSSKQSWGTILEPEFGMGYQKMTDYEIDQTVNRLYKIREQRERIYDRKEERDLSKSEIKNMVKRLSKFNQVPDSRRVLKDSDYKSMGVLNSYAWKGYN